MCACFAEQSGNTNLPEHVDIVRDLGLRIRSIKPG